MADSLESARALADQVRFSGDNAAANAEEQADSVSHVREMSYQLSIELSPALTPRLAEQLSKVRETLHVHDGALSAFIYPSAELQASCFAGRGSDCIIHFSSALISLLDEDEFAFVAGHELGHFLLGHHFAKVNEHRNSAEFFFQRRAQEISVDRIGLLACGSMTTAIRAMMKTASGLTDRHLRFDVSAFLAQLRKIDTTAGTGGSGLTHPSMVVRSRSLLWFSMSEYFSRGSSTGWVKERQQIDARIERDLHKFVDGAARNYIDAIKADILFWMIAHEVVRQGRFSRKAQEEVKRLYGAETLGRLSTFLTDLQPGEIEAAVLTRLNAARDQLLAQMPSAFKSEMAAIDAAFAQVKTSISQ